MQLAYELNNEKTHLSPENVADGNSEKSEQIK